MNKLKLITQKDDRDHRRIEQDETRRGQGTLIKQ